MELKEALEITWQMVDELDHGRSVTIHPGGDVAIAFRRISAAAVGRD